MVEKATLAASSSLCQISDQESAGHYCNIIWPSHNWVGLAIAAGNATLSYGLDYDEAFGDLYGMVDTTVIAPEKALNTTASRMLGGVASAYQSNASAVIQSLQVPVPMTVAALNADPTCASTCPTADSGIRAFRASPCGDIKRAHDVGKSTHRTASRGKHVLSNWRLHDVLAFR